MIDKDNDEQYKLLKSQVWLVLSKMFHRMGHGEASFEVWFDHMYENRKPILDALAEDD